LRKFPPLILIFSPSTRGEGTCRARGSLPTKKAASNSMLSLWPPRAWHHGRLRSTPSSSPRQEKSCRHVPGHVRHEALEILESARDGAAIGPVQELDRVHDRQMC